MTFNQAQSFQIKSQLAKLLSSENIIVEHKSGARTASFDVKRRVLTLPVWQNISEHLYDMLVVHETGHALDTPTEGWIEAIDTIANKYHSDKPSNKAKMAVKDFLNVIEDARIDKRQKRRYPGSKRNYVAGYKELMERNFFGIQNKDVNSLGLVDRINLYFKTSDIVIKFSAAEQEFIKRIANAETFEEVVALSDEVYGYCLAAKQEQSETNIAHDFDEEDGTESLEAFEDADDMDSIDDETEETSVEGDSSEDSEEESADEETDGEGDVSSTRKTDDNEESEDFVPESLTENAARENAASIVQDTGTVYEYVTLPKFNMDKIVDDFTKVIPQMQQSILSFDQHYCADQLNWLNEWKRKENDTISYMVKEFESKKAADTYARTSISKTGVIDTNKLHSYKYNEDIFRKLAVTPTGKNHGFVMLLDWSVSMAQCLESTLKQLFSLTMFCKRVQIPFEVYLFRSVQRNDNFQGSCYDYKDGDIVMRNFKLRNVLSSRMNLATFNKALECLWMARICGVSSDYLGRTPLNQAILALDQIVNDFQKKNKVQVCNTIVLTDGSSDPIHSVHNELNLHSKPYVPGQKTFYILRDDVTGRTYHFSSHPWSWYTDATNTFLRILKSRTGTNLIGFFLYNGTFKNLYRTGLVDYTFYHNNDNMAKWRENNYIGLTSAGYDEYFIIGVGRNTEVETDLQVNAKMTKAKIAKEFMKFSNKKAVNRVLLSKFITRIAKAAA
jgi:hypothetical protein